MSSADSNEVAQCLLNLGVISTVSSNTFNDTLCEISLVAVAFVVAVVFAASLTDPSVEALWDKVWARRSWNWWRRLGRGRNWDGG